MEEQQQLSEPVETSKEFQQSGVNLDAMEILHVKRKKTIQTVKKSNSSSMDSSVKKLMMSSNSAIESMMASTSVSAIENTVKMSTTSEASAIENA